MEQNTVLKFVLDRFPIGLHIPCEVLGELWGSKAKFQKKLHTDAMDNLLAQFGIYVSVNDGARTRGLQRTPGRDFDPRAAARAAEAVAAVEGSDDDDEADDDEADDDEADDDEADDDEADGEDASPSSSKSRLHSRSRARAHAGGLPRPPGRPFAKTLAGSPSRM